MGNVFLYSNLVSLLRKKLKNMATKTFEGLKQMAIQIRDEKANKQNTATRIGTQMLEHLNKLEQEYYDKTNIDEQKKQTDVKLSNLDKKFNEFNISVLYPTNGVYGTNKYTLAGAIEQVTNVYRKSGVKIIFVNESNITETWEYIGGAWNVDSFTPVGAKKILDIEESYGENVKQTILITEENSKSNLWFLLFKSKNVKKISLKALENETAISFVNIFVQTIDGGTKYGTIKLEASQYSQYEVADDTKDYIYGIYLGSGQMASEIGKSIKLQILYGSTQDINPLVSEAIESLKNTPERKLQDKAKEKGCDRGVRINSSDDLFSINAEETDKIYYLLDSDIYINTDIDKESIELPQKCIFDFNDHTIKMNNKNHCFKSPFDFGDDGIHFEEYPLLLYNRNKIERPFFNSSNEDWTINVLSGMFRVNDDVVYLKDWTRGKKINTMLACFCNCKILIDSDFTYTYGQDNNVSYGINSNVEFSCINGAKMILKQTEGFGVVNKIKIVGTNVKIDELYIDNYDKTSPHKNGVNFEIKCNKEIPVCNVSITDSNIIGVIETLYANDSLSYCLNITKQ